MASAAALACADWATHLLLLLWAARRGATVPVKPDRWGLLTPVGAGTDILPDSIMVGPSLYGTYTGSHKAGQQGGRSWRLGLRSRDRGSCASLSAFEAPKLSALLSPEHISREVGKTRIGKL